MFSSVNATLLQRFKLPGICIRGSEVQSRGSSAMLTILMADCSCINGSVDIAAILSPSARATALQGCLYAMVYRHSPVSTFQIFVELSAEAVIRKEESPAEERRSVSYTCVGITRLSVLFANLCNVSACTRGAYS